MYDYTKETGEIKEIYRIDGDEIYEEKENIDCTNCWYCINRLKGTKEYIKELQKLMEKEDE